ncbi:MAG: hypothetical protein ABIG45_07045 [Bacillota bacterium]
MTRKTYRLLMILQGFLWFYLAAENALSDRVALPIVILAFLDGACYVVLGLLDIRKLLWRMLSLAFLAANLILTFTDQLGFYDYLVMGWNIVLLILVFTLAIKRKKA